MIRVEVIRIAERLFTGVEVKLPKTTLLAVASDKGYIMCGALDINLLNEKLSDRRIVAGRAVGVRTIEDLLNAPLDMVTEEAERLGIFPGMIGRAAMLKM